MQYKGEKAALLEARKHAAWYMRGLKGAAELRAAAGSLQTLADLERLCAQVLKKNAE